VVNGRPLQLIGVGDLWSGMCAPAAAFARTPPRRDAVRLLLNHNPDAKDRLRAFDWDLVLCGHTHGGQLRLPFFGTPFAPVVDKRYVSGLHRWEERWLYVTRGVGNLHGMRFNCRPQISVIDVV
jgi:predicted MPP superfamily phosphohydrolase